MNSAKLKSEQESALQLEKQVQAQELQKQKKRWALHQQGCHGQGRLPTRRPQEFLREWSEIFIDLASLY